MNRQNLSNQAEPPLPAPFHPVLKQEPHQYAMELVTGMNTCDRRRENSYTFAFCANTVASQAMYLFERPKLRLTAIYRASL
jgi:hypothetical protein